MSDRHPVSLARPGLITCQRRFVATADGDFRHASVKNAYHAAHRAYYAALARALGQAISRTGGYVHDEAGHPVGIRELERTAVDAGLLAESSYESGVGR